MHILLIARGIIITAPRLTRGFIIQIQLIETDNEIFAQLLKKKPIVIKNVLLDKLLKIFESLQKNHFLSHEPHNKYRKRISLKNKKSCGFPQLFINIKEL